MKTIRFVIGFLLLLNAIQAFATPVTLTFNEIASRPVHGVTIAGATFGYTVNGVVSDLAVYNSVGPGDTNVVKAPALVGDTRGILTIHFSAPSDRLGFALAFNSIATLPVAATIKIFDAALNPIQTYTVSTLATNSFTEGLFAIAGVQFTRAEISFHSAASAFAIDNLTFNLNVPEPASLLLLGSGLAGLATLLRKRKKTTK